MIDITSIINAAAWLVIAIAMTYIGHLERKKDRKIDIGTWVAAAEQLAKTGLVQDKKTWVVEQLAQRGYKVNTAEVDAAIEAAVAQLKQPRKENISVTMAPEVVPDSHTDGKTGEVL